ncbi:acyl-CoA thioesterase, partial [Pseudomonas aeruginosa]|nr:acyl-CoA thioesterase [Pseudomonas aeruginosa]
MTIENLWPLPSSFASMVSPARPDESKSA